MPRHVGKRRVGKALAAFSYRYDDCEIKLLFEEGILWFLDGGFPVWIPYEENTHGQCYEDVLGYHRVAANWFEFEV